MQDANTLVHRLATMLSAKKVEHIDSDRWDSYCRFLGHKRDDSDSEEVVSIYGMSRKPYAHQAFLAMFALQSCYTKLNGIFIGDAVGTGKTTAVLTLFFLQRQITLMYEEVRESRSRNDGRHLLASSLETGYQQPLDAACPSKLLGTGCAYRFHLECPCVEQSFLRQCNIRPKNGVFVCIVPPGLLEVWATQWDVSVDKAEAESMGADCLVLHGSLNTIDDSHKPGKRRSFDNQTTGAVWQDGLPECLTGTIQDEISPNGTTTYKTIGRAVNTRWMLLSSPDSMESALKRDFGPGTVWKTYKGEDTVQTWTVARGRHKGKEMTRTVPGQDHHVPRIATAYLIFDEFHKYPNATSPSVKYGRGMLGQAGLPSVIPMSATPFESSPINILQYLSMMKHNSPADWVKSESLRRCMPSTLEKLGTDFRHLESKLLTAHRKVTEAQKQIKEAIDPSLSREQIDTKKARRRLEVEQAKAQVKALRGEIQEVIRQCTKIVSTVFISRDLRTRWFRSDRRIIRLPRHKVHDVPCPAKVGWEGRLLNEHVRVQALIDEANATARARAAEKNIPFVAKKHLQKQHLLRQYITCPKLIDIYHNNVEADGRPRLRLTIEEIKDGRWFENPEKSPYWDEIDKIVKSSTKLEVVGKLLDRFQNEKDWEGDLVKQIFTTSFGTIALILYIVGCPLPLKAQALMLGSTSSRSVESRGAT